MPSVAVATVSMRSRVSLKQSRNSTKQHEAMTHMAICHDVWGVMPRLPLNMEHRGSHAKRAMKEPP